MKRALHIAGQAAMAVAGTILWAGGYLGALFLGYAFFAFILPGLFWLFLGVEP